MPENRQKQAPKRTATRTSWKPGQSGNPGGRPKAVGHVRDLAREHTKEAIETLVDIMRNGDKDVARARAAEVLLDRAWGRAPQAMEISGPQGGPVEWKQARQELNNLIAGLAARDTDNGAASEPKPD